MISFKKYTDIVGDIANKLKVTKDIAVNALIKAQERGINPLKWQRNISLLTTFAALVAEYDPTVEEGSSDKADMYKLMTKGLKVMAGSPKQKEIIKQINVIRKRMGMPLMREDRDYKDEYKKFQSSEKMRKYRSELNRYNREKGTYGNRDGKDASHKKGKIVGFEDENVNRGRAEKSRLVGSKRN